ncbi:glycosyltransferase [Mucilaginibacter sp.]|uniref:glycosyltransferase n=1 Tax=Mucilaginibacter sp. TaxID=1882438 RepID=UPI00374D7897
MSKRLKLGLIFFVNGEWIGGTYYILNLISALKSLPEINQPIITILSKNKADYLIAKETGYPFLKFQNPYSTTRNFIEIIIDKIHKIVFKRYIVDKRISAKQVDVLFPANNEWVFDKIENKMFWFPDFQHIVYPDFFSDSEIKIRNEMLIQIAQSNQNLLLSSNAAKADWDAFTIKKNCAVHVIPFAVTHPPLDDLIISEILDEFNIKGKYFIVSNQFWVHKNHMVILKAALLMSSEHVAVQFIFTGKEDDYRHAGYFKTITDFITSNNLTSSIKMLGLIDRKKQLKLMQHSTAVIQPSLFEGWSTVIEDAKLLGKQVIASNIDVHKEQLGHEGIYFDPYSEDDLILKINESMYVEPTKNFQYEKNVEDFGFSFLQLLEKAIAN